jgi:hypothetical protein
LKRLLATLALLASLATPAMAKPELLIDYSPSSKTTYDAIADEENVSEYRYRVPENKQNAFEYRPKKGPCIDESLNSRVTNVMFGGEYNQTLLLVRVDNCNEGHFEWGKSNYLLVYNGKTQVAKISTPYRSSISLVPEDLFPYSSTDGYLILTSSSMNQGYLRSSATLYKTLNGKLKELKDFGTTYSQDCGAKTDKSGRKKGSKIFYDPVVGSYSSIEVIETCSL